MSKMKVQDATKELSRRAAQLLGNVSSVRAAAEKALADMRRLESGFVKQEEAERLEEQQKALNAQSKAWTMPDDVPAEPEKAADAQEATPAAAEAKADKPAPAKPAAPRASQQS